MKFKVLGLAALAVATFTVPSLAQRYLNYDETKSISLMGTVIGLDWMNPNSELFVRAKDPATGKDEQWVLVMAPPSRTKQFGWKPTTLKPGDAVSFGDASGQGQIDAALELVTVTLPDGRTLRATGPTARKKRE